ncbi:gamma-glutamylcyclotransferase [Pontibacillus sp. HMF3514]|uniref:gamma-glutamylcyclotransferase family protein n=1 Tax=Pontibacillus sp. HMF3514 TaxID=2692425 RepID=UPI00131F8172|nr:gamma-glutamylcyclotransferase family protein [Pontibacillus sp. HMF3514]QHE52425.1 gamma-glutamylcyclotransferase [Pontibacillus sp. HMF3514]
MNSYVFVYGTLRSGQPNAYLLKEAKLRYQNAWTYGILYSTDQYYPILIQSSTDKVYGDVYEVTSTQLGLLDELEGYHGANKANLYNRYKQCIYTAEERSDYKW